MGLSASQARLLSITARLSDNELHSQQIANAKVRLADQAQEASREYVNSLDTQKLVYTMYDAKGNSTKVNLTPAVMYEYAEMKNQYGISNNAGQLLVKKADAVNFMNSNTFQEFYENYVTSSIPINQAWTEQTEARNLLDTYEAELAQKLAEEPKLNLETVPKWTGTIPVQPPAVFRGTLRDEPVIPEAISKPEIEDYYDVVTNTTYQTNTTNKIKDLANTMQSLNAGSTSATGIAYNKAIAAAKSVEQILAPIIYLMIQENEIQYLSDVDYDINGNKLNQYVASYSGSKQLQLTYVLNESNVTENNTSLTKSGVAVTNNDRSIYSRLSEAQEAALFHIYANALTLICLFPNGNQDPSKVYDDLYYEQRSGSYNNNVNGVERKSLFRSGAIDNIYLNAYDGGIPTNMNASMVKPLIFNNGYDFKLKNLMLNDSSVNMFNVTTINEIQTEEEVFDEESYNSDLREYNQNQEDIAAAVRDHNAWLTEQYEYACCQHLYNNDEDAYNTACTRYDEYQTYLEELEEVNNINAERTRVWQTPHDEWQVEYDAIMDKIRPLKDQVDITVQKYTGNNNSHYQWYYNLWCRMNGGEGVLDEYHNIYRTTAANSNDQNSGTYWKVLEDNLYNSSSWLQFALEQGLVTLEQVQFENPAESGTGITNAKWASKIFTTCTDIQFVDDETAVARAEAIYTRKLNEIEAKDKKYDNDIKKLDTEHNALQTEYESVKSVVDKNVERSFKAFS